MTVGCVTARRFARPLTSTELASQLDGSAQAGRIDQRRRADQTLML
jgi:hypothetical protein